MTNDDTSDGLLERARRGDESALDALLLRHLGSLEAYVRLRAGPLVRSKESISDLVQSVCVEVLRSSEGFRYVGEAAFRAWLFKQAFHKIVNKNVFYTRKRRDVGREQMMDDDVADARVRMAYATICTPSAVARGREDVERFERAFAELTEDQREAISLVKLAGLSYGEAAERMQRSEPALRNLVWRGLSRLSAKLPDADG